MNVKGLNIQDVMQTPLETLTSLSRKDLATLTGRLVSAANKRVRLLESRGLPIKLESYKNGKFSVKGKNQKALLEEFNRVSNFLNKKTTKVREYKKWQKFIDSQTKGLNDKDKFWKIYKKLYHEGGLFDHYKYETWEVIKEYILDDRQDSDLMKDTTDKLMKKLLGGSTIDASRKTKDGYDIEDVLDIDSTDE